MQISINTDLQGKVDRPITEGVNHICDWSIYLTASADELEVCALCGDADPHRVCRELHFV